VSRTRCPEGFGEDSSILYTLEVQGDEAVPRIVSLLSSTPMESVLFRSLSGA
jgi:hypothetical protein